MFNQRRNSIAGPLLFFYLLPVILLSWYSLERMPPTSSWKIFAIGLLTASCGCLVLYLLMSQNQVVSIKEVQEVPVMPDTEQQEVDAETKRQNEHLAQANESLNTDLTNIKQEYEMLKNQHQQILQEHESYRQGIEAQLHRKDEILQGSHHLMREQKTLIDKHVQHIAFLENKERDLHFELKTLLQATNLDNGPTTSAVEKRFQELPTINVSTPETAKGQLQRCLDIASKMTSSNYHHQESSPFREYSMDNSMLDLRRLFDSLNDENGAMVMVYSQKENRILFVNPEIKNVLGWTPEKFVQSFPELVQDGYDVWKKNIGQLYISPEVEFSISMKAKTGNNVTLNWHLGTIYTGPFRNHAIGIAYKQ